MATIVIGGQARNIGKTSVICTLISAMPERRWTAIKIAQCHHAGPCHCHLAGHSVAISEELDPTTRTDSSRYLAAGAARSLWLRTRPGHLAEAMPLILAAIASPGDTILESNSVLAHLQPDLYATILDPTASDFKPSALHHLHRANAILLLPATPAQPAWSGASLPSQEIPIFQIAAPTYRSSEFLHLVRKILRQ